MTLVSKLLKAAAICGIPLLFTLPMQVQAQSHPWVEVGDRTLRSDIEILASRGLITGLVTTWPIPAGQLKKISDGPRLRQEPEYVQRAADRVLAYLRGRRAVEDVSGFVEARVTNSPNMVRDFGTVARDQADVRVGADFDGEDAAVSLRLGGQTRFSGDQRVAALDGSAISGVWDNVKFYGGLVDQWYGAGWDSSLILSNNARPFPKIGLMRENPTAFETPWLSWLGPWQINVFAGLLNGPRVATNTAMASFRLTLAPIDGLEIALTRMSQFCGSGHPCNPGKAIFNLRNDEKSANDSNDEATIEVKGMLNAGAVLITPYMQLMNEDTGPFKHSDTSYLFGSSFAAPLGDNGANWRVTTEYTDTVATLNAFGFGNLVHGVSYNNYSYADGFRYRGRTLGFSLDSDSRLLSLIGQVTDAHGWTYRAAYRLAKISTQELALQQSLGGAFNTVSSVPVKINQAELGLSIPYSWGNLDFAVRGQDGLPTAVQGSSGDKVAAEVGLVYKF